MSHFIFEKGEWIGNGVVSFTQSPDVLHFRVRWTIKPASEDTFQCTQLVEVVGGDQMVNTFTVKLKDQESFVITIDNEVLGSFTGKGIVEDQVVAWEFRERGAFEGFEVYEKQDEGYSFRAEYLSSDQARTSIHGKIWKKEKSAA